MMLSLPAPQDTGNNLHIVVVKGTDEEMPNIAHVVGKDPHVRSYSIVQGSIVILCTYSSKKEDMWRLVASLHRRAPQRQIWAQLDLPGCPVAYHFYSE